MQTGAFFIVLFLQFTSLSTAYEQENFRSSFYTIEEKRKLVLGKISKKTVHVPDSLACVMTCNQAQNWCKSANFIKIDSPNEGRHKCQLFGIDKMAASSFLFPNDNTDFLSLKVFLYKTCAELQSEESERTRGVYRIVPTPSLFIDVYCDLATGGGGWTIIQRRLDGSENFYRDWADYKRGFGNKSGEYWLGLDAIHEMTSQQEYKLRVDIEDFDGEIRYAVYDTFVVGDEASNYLLTIGQYSGNAGDGLTNRANNQSFSTKDRDNDQNNNGQCAQDYQGAGWYTKSCLNANPNGRYLHGPNVSPGVGVTWGPWKGASYSLKRMELKIRPVDWSNV